MKLAEKYERRTIKKYGDAVAKFPPFLRQLQVFKSEAGRLAIQACAKSNLQLWANPCGGGIAECIQKTHRNLDCSYCFCFAAAVFMGM
jgi:hypothetical protein